MHSTRFARSASTFLAAALVVAACAKSSDETAGAGETDFPVAMEEVATGLDTPVAVATAPGDDRLYVLERYAGTIRIIDDGTLLDEPFLDLRDRLVARGEDPRPEIFERGLLGLAFHPDYERNGRFFVYYADLTGVPELVEYRMSDDPSRADPDSAVVLRTFSQSPIHYGGTLVFGPDGALWLSIGDGDDSSIAPDVSNVRGSLLRFDVSTPGEAVGAPGNPYLGDHPGADEVWASGLRNPWRFSIDAEDGLLYVADVGFITREEINVVPLDEPGLDFGWPTFEGTACGDEIKQPEDRDDADDETETTVAETTTSTEPFDCDPTGTVVPVIEKTRSVDACAVIGGHVYRGSALPELAGYFLYSDFCFQYLRAFRYEDGQAVDDHKLFGGLGRITSIALDHDGEVLLVEQDTGRILRVVPAD